MLNFHTEKNIIGRVVQDVVTQPTRKWARAQCDSGFLEWYCGSKPGVDTVKYGVVSGKVETEEIVKTRPDDFFEEIKHINSVMNNLELYNDSPITLKKGLETMLVITASHLSAQNNCPVKIDYKKGFITEALSF